MTYKRIIFALLYQDNNFFLSRNFRLQKVGDLNWILNNFGFNEACRFIDEIVLINIKKEPNLSDYNNFLKMVNLFRKKIFLPLTIGGGINSLSIAKLYFENGADKILINSFSTDYKLIKSIQEEYGSQAISIMIDCKKNLYNKTYEVYVQCGTKKINELKSFLKNNKNLKSCGEIILNSIDQDGVGTGFDLKIMKLVKHLKNPILVMGGAGKPEHFTDVLGLKNINGAITANLFNFLGDGLKRTREILLKKNIKVALL
jgi:cyclase